MFEIEKSEKPRCYKYIKKIPCQYTIKGIQKLNVSRSFAAVDKEKLILHFMLKQKYKYSDFFCR